MNNKNLIYQKLNKENTYLSFPYPPLYKEENTDYICFCNSPNITSNFWKIYQVDSFSSTNIQTILNSYSNKKELLPNQILTGPIFKKDDCNLPPFIPVPSFYELTDLSFDESLFSPTKDLSGNYIFKKNPVYTNGPYDGRTLLLTIGVPVSNQIQTIDQCLSHIKPILEQLDSELLVINTGSTDGTIDICKSYGARIINFPWCNNMSAARNEGIYHALGAWYLSIDDDEWFENVDEIIQFFQYGLYKLYDAASYIQRNYHQFSGNIYSDHHTIRMARIIPELHFEGRIHDALVPPLSARLYQLSCYANHYGFIHEKPEHKLNKYKRNASLLLYDILEYPNDLRYNYQLAHEFHIMNYDKEAFAYYLRGISIGEENPNTFYQKTHILHLFSLLAKQKNELLFSFIDLLKDSISLTNSELVYLFYIQTDLSFQLKKTPDEVLSYIQSYKKYYKLYNQSKEKGSIRSTISIDVYDIKSITQIHTIAFCMYCQKGEESSALVELDSIHPEYLHTFIKSFCSHFIKASDKVYSKVMKILSTSDIIRWSNEILSAFIQSFDELFVKEICLSRFCNILSNFTISLIEQYLILQLEEDISPEAKSFLCNIALSLNLEDSTLQELYFFSSLLYKALGHSTNPEDELFVFERYIILTGKFVQLYYHPELLNQINVHIIPSEFLAAYYINSAINKKTDILTNFQIASSICPKLKKQIDSFYYSICTSSVANQQLDQLTIQLKQNIYTLLSLNQTKEAYELLSEFQSICPDDIEIKKLLEQISSR